MCRSIKTLHNYKHRPQTTRSRASSPLRAHGVSERAGCGAARTRLANSRVAAAWSAGSMISSIQKSPPDRKGERSFCRRASISASLPWGQPPASKSAGGPPRCALERQRAPAAPTATRSGTRSGRPFLWAAPATPREDIADDHGAHGTVVCQMADIARTPCLIVPVRSASRPMRKPGQSTR